MSGELGRWRATYTPGPWLLLCGPAAAVVLEPADATWSDLVETLWDEVVQAESLADLAARRVGGVFSLGASAVDELLGLRGDLVGVDLVAEQQQRVGPRLGRLVAHPLDQGQQRVDRPAPGARAQPVGGGRPHQQRGRGHGVTSEGARCVPGWCVLDHAKSPRQ